MNGPFQQQTFRRLFAGRVVTNIGDSLYFVAAMWLVYSLTGDPFYTGLAGFLTMLPATFQFLAGPLVDRWSIRLTLVATQLVQAVIVLIIPAAHLLGVLSVGLIMVVMPTLAALNQLVYPAQSAALPRILDDEDLVSANSAFAIAYQGLSMVANGIGGILIGIFGAVALFAIDAVTFLVAALIFASVTIPSARAARETAGKQRETDAQGGTPSQPVAADGGGEMIEEMESYVSRLRAGWRVVRGTFLMWLVIGAAVVNFTLGMVLAALPAYADTMHITGMLAAIGAAGVYGILMASFAGGNLLGAIFANVVGTRPVGFTLIASSAIAAILWSAALLADWLPVTAFLIMVAFIPIGVVNVQLAAVIQSAPPKELVGRVSSILGSASTAMIPFGSLAGGAVAGAFGPTTALAAFSVGSVLLASYVLLIPELRRLGPPAELTVEVGLD